MTTSAGDVIIINLPAMTLLFNFGTELEKTGVMYNYNKGSAILLWSFEN